MKVFLGERERGVEGNGRTEPAWVLVCAATEGVDGDRDLEWAAEEREVLELSSTYPLLVPKTFLQSKNVFFFPFSSFFSKMESRLL